MQTVLMIESSPAELRALRQRLMLLLEKAGLSERSREEVLVAVGEGCTNAIRHAYSGEPGHKIRVAVEERKGRMVFKIRDYGRKIDLSKVKTPELPPQKAGGLGIYLMKTLMDEMEYNTRHRQGNELILTKCKTQGVPHENPVRKR